MEKLTSLRQPLQKLPPILGSNQKSTGYTKPEPCSYCRFNYKNTDSFGSGFCPDYVPPKPKILFIFPYPSDDEVNHGKVLKWEFFKEYIEPLGKQEDCQVSHLLRCTLGRVYPKKGESYRGKVKYPTGSLKKNAENTCRYYDQHTYLFRPSRILITLDPADVYSVTAYKRQIQCDVAKAFKWVEEGHKPVVLLGNEPAEFFAPFIVGKGSAKTWRGHFWDTDEWPFKGGERYIEQPEFKEAKIKKW